MITNYRVQNFKNLIDTGEDFNPQSLNVIVGPNGCGKTSLFQSMDFLRAFFMSSLELYVQEKGWQLRDLANIHARDFITRQRLENGEVKQVRLTSPRAAIHWNVTAELHEDSHGNSKGKYTYIISLSTRVAPRVIAEQLSFKADDAEELILLDRNPRQVRILNRETSELTASEHFAPLSSLMATLDPSRDRAKYPEIFRFREWVEKFRSFSLWDPKILRSTNRGKHEELGPNGEHLASLLALLKQKKPQDFNKLLRRIKRVFPYIADITLTGGKGWGWRMIQQHEEFNGRRSNLGSQQMSDGVLRLLAVASLLYVDNTPSVLMFEEPENGIHPQLLREVVSILRELTLQKPPRQCQVFFTTHSPYVLDEFINYPNEVFIMNRHPNSYGVTITQLSELDETQFARLNDDFPSLGEAWFTGLIGGTAKGE